MNQILRIADLVWLLGLAIFVLIGVDDVPFHVDESTIIFMSQDYHYLVQKRDLDPVLYDESPANPTLQSLRILNGTVSKMAIGFAWDMAGLTVYDLKTGIDFSYDYRTNVEMGNFPGDRLLRAARWSSALMLVVSAWAVMGITWQVTRHNMPHIAVVRLAAWAASAIYVTTPVVVINGRRAMFEGAFLCFSTLTVLVAAHLALEQQSETKTRRSLFLWSALTGILAGLAVASKHTAVVMVGAVFLALFTEPLFRPLRQTIWGRLRSYTVMYCVRFLVMGLLALGMFVFLNPAWWSDFPRMPGRVINERRHLLSDQAEAAGRYTTHLERIEALLENAFWAEPEYAENPLWSIWSTFPEVRTQIATYESRWYAGRRGGVIEGGLLIVAFLVGLLVLTAHWQTGSVWLVLTWLLITALVVELATAMNWQRYYDPLSPIVAVVAGTGVGWIVGAILARRSANPDPAPSVHS